MKQEPLIQPKHKFYLVRSTYDNVAVRLYDSVFFRIRAALESSVGLSIRKRGPSVSNFINYRYPVRDFMEFRTKRKKYDE